MSGSHRCVAYANDAQLRDAAAQFLAEGLAQGERVSYFGWGGRDALRERLGDVDGLYDSGAAQLAPFENHFRADEAPDPLALRAFWADLTDAALAAGFTALRAGADTPVWRRARPQRTEFMRGERLVDRYRLDHPFSLLCAFDSSVLSQEGLDEIASIHATADGVSPPFHLHACSSAAFSLQGEVDSLSARLFERVLSTVSTADQRREVTIDASGLVFIDHQSLAVLEAHGRHLNAMVVLQDPPSVASVVARLLDLQHVHLDGER